MGELLSRRIWGAWELRLGTCAGHRNCGQGHLWGLWPGRMFGTPELQLGRVLGTREPRDWKGAQGRVAVGQPWGWGCAPRVTRACVQVGWTRGNLEKLLEKAGEVTLVLKKIPLDLPDSPPSPRRRVSDPSAPSPAQCRTGLCWEPGRDAQSRVLVPKALGDLCGGAAGSDAPSTAPRSIFGCCGSPRCRKQRVSRQPRVPDLQVSPIPGHPNSPSPAIAGVFGCTQGPFPTILGGKVPAAQPLPASSLGSRQ